MYAFIDEQRDAFGVEPICEVLQAAPSAYRGHAARRKGPCLLSHRAQRDAALMPKIERVWNANFQVYGADKVWKPMKREGVSVARCTLEWLMQRLGLQGATRGKVMRTTVPDARCSPSSNPVADSACLSMAILTLTPVRIVSCWPDLVDEVGPARRRSHHASSQPARALSATTISGETLA